MPVPVWVTFGGKLLGVFLAIAVLLVIMMVGGMVMQAVQGYARLQPTLYLKVVGAIALPTAFAVVALAMGVHAIVNQKFVSHLIVITYWVVLPVMSNLGFDHRLYQVGRPPDFVYSDMAGWGPYLTRILTLQAYSVAACLALAAVGYLVLLRGTDSGWASRRHAAGQRLRRGGAVAVGLFAITAITLAAFFTMPFQRYTEVHAESGSSWSFGTTTRITAAAATHRRYAPPRFSPKRAAAQNGTLRAVVERALSTRCSSLFSHRASPVNRFEATAGTGLPSTR
jgi:hypothetical protein